MTWEEVEVGGVVRCQLLSYLTEQVQQGISPSPALVSPLWNLDNTTCLCIWHLLCFPLFISLYICIPAPFYCFLCAPHSPSPIMYHSFHSSLMNYLSTYPATSRKASHSLPVSRETNRRPHPLPTCLYQGLRAWCQMQSSQCLPALCPGQLSCCTLLWR